MSFPKTRCRPAAAYQIIHDELNLDGNPALNLASFVTTWMEPEADKLMTESFGRNYIDADEYPQTTEIHNRCVNMLARLFNAPEAKCGRRLRHGGLVRGDPPGRPGPEMALAAPAAPGGPAH